MINKYAIELWCKLLRSGEYQQGYSRLRKREDYCANGLLCEAHRLTDSGYEWVLTGESSGMYSYMTFTSIIPDEVLEWAGILDILKPMHFYSSIPIAIEVIQIFRPGIFGNGISKTVENLNDGRICGFPQIADIVEKAFLA